MVPLLGCTPSCLQHTNLCFDYCSLESSQWRNTANNKSDFELWISAKFLILGCSPRSQIGLVFRPPPILEVSDYQSYILDCRLYNASCLTNIKILSPCVKKRGSKFNWIKKTAYPRIWCQSLERQTLNGAVDSNILTFLTFSFWKSVSKLKCFKYLSLFFAVFFPSVYLPATNGG